jgi:polar amino acid transport system ATP-binding protein
MPTSGGQAAPTGPASEGLALLRVEHVDKFYGSHQVLCDVSLEVTRQEALVILGPSGSGKSTLLRCIAQLVDIDRGRIYLDGELLGFREAGAQLKKLPPRAVEMQRRETGMVFQSFNLFAHLTALENITLAPRHVLGQSRRAAEERGLQLLERVGLLDRAGHYPSQLSGGQQQRVAIARAMAMGPKILLFDEPTSALDPEMIREVLDIMVDLAHRGMTMVVVTHEIGFAREVAHRVVFMEEGKILEVGETAAFFDSPRLPRTAAFLRQIL